MQFLLVAAYTRIYKALCWTSFILLDASVSCLNLCIKKRPISHCCTAQPQWKYIFWLELSWNFFSIVISNLPPAPSPPSFAQLARLGCQDIRYYPLIPRCAPSPFPPLLRTNNLISTPTPSPSLPFSSPSPLRPPLLQQQQNANPFLSAPPVPSLTNSKCCILFWFYIDNESGEEEEDWRRGASSPGLPREDRVSRAQLCVQRRQYAPSVPVRDWSVGGILPSTRCSWWLCPSGRQYSFAALHLATASRSEEKKYGKLDSIHF